ncbi:glycosyl transferase [Vallitalea longa]|uniref:Glycosyl transferase n=1 Tax=Vallitalea longa TaxID=2936439 RepID=A0A9W5YE82_9FIRM|nr:glycosyltransferase family 2 protein [Vallitalea longa]GKX31031.1 glycosyl transferase [Vallitalea longa]
MIDVSVIIPVYNQAEQLMITLDFFAKQTYDFNRFEIIVVDDGSTERIIQKINNSYLSTLPYKIIIIRQGNKGRAAARNKGVEKASGEYLIFCDADRFPNNNYIKYYVDNKAYLSEFAIVGCPVDYYGKRHRADICKKDIQGIHRFSRESNYYKKIRKIFDEQGLTKSQIAWVSYLVGNSCISLDNFKKVGGFDPIFKDWGFEHFDFAFRLLKKGMYIKSCPYIYNYHIPHSRPDGFYKAMIEKSTVILNSKYPKYDFTPFKYFLSGELDLQRFEQIFNNNI